MMETSLLQTKREDWPFIILASLIFFSALLVTLWDFLIFQKMTFHLSLVNVAGLGLFFIGISIRRVAKRTLGKYYSYGLRTLQKHELIKHGIYRYIRHPAYLAMLIYSLAVPLIFSSLYGFLLMSGLIPCTLYRIKIEESMLLEKFGKEYLEYMKKTKKMIPLIY